MKNEFLRKFQNTYVLKITGKNPRNFIRKIISHSIEIYSLKQVHPSYIQIRIAKKDYPKIMDLKTIYDIKIVDVGGIIRVKRKLLSYQTFLCAFLFGIFLLFFLSHLVFSIEIVDTNKEIRTLLLDELEKYGLSKYHFRKSYSQIQKIKENIIQENKDKIEWLEIERIGTKYVVRVERRKKEKEKEKIGQKDVISKKSAVILKIDAQNGEIVKSVGDYVEKGETIISGAIKLNDEVKGYIGASGKVYGEVWYKVSVTYPYKRDESYQTGKSKKVYTLSFLHNRFELFNFDSYKNKDIESKIIWKHTFLPISFTKELQREKKVIKKTYTKKEATINALKLAKEKLSRTLHVNEYIMDQKSLKVTEKNSKIVIDVFYTVYEDITDTKETEIEIIKDKSLEEKEE